ncbi:MAG: hypothetical protein HYX84_09020 [Chloroflexi bacterium]|nr:hypothetical protein [Chloroflexota bacterium]
MKEASKSENFQPEITWIKIIWIKTYKTIRGELTTKVVCMVVGGAFVVLMIISAYKPEISLPPNSSEPHLPEAPVSSSVPQWFNNNIVVNATATNTVGYSTL